MIEMALSADQFGEIKNVYVYIPRLQVNQEMFKVYWGWYQNFYIRILSKSPILPFLN